MVVVCVRVKGGRNLCAGKLLVCVRSIGARFMRWYVDGLCGLEGCLLCALVGGGLCALEA